jgi:hypothetical protein
MARRVRGFSFPNSVWERMFGKLCFPSPGRGETAFRRQGSQTEFGNQGQAGSRRYGEGPRMATHLPRTEPASVFVVAMAVLALFGVACFLPCIDGGPHRPPSDLDFHLDSGWHFGLEILLFGWSGSNNGLPWSANVVLLLGLGCLVVRLRRAAAVLGFIATVLGLTTWWVRPHETMMVGYYVWQASHMVLAGGALWAFLQPIRPENLMRVP